MNQEIVIKRLEASDLRVNKWPNSMKDRLLLLLLLLLKYTYCQLYINFRQKISQ
jgi:hypothetical protein